ncbi:MAG: glycosyltransferase family 4 protein, partial [Syntrophothermus sp.]
DLLISAFAGITKEFENTRLLIVGDGSLRPQLQDQAEILGISDKTTFTGAVSYTDVPEWHRKIDIFVNPSHFESFGVSVLEASASGVPVVASDAGGLPEVVENEVTGLLFPSGDIEKLQQAILTLLGNAALREKMGQAGREMVLNRFELLACAELQMDLYRQLIVQ